MSGTHLLQSYSELSSPIHRAPAWIKLVLTLALVIGVSFVPPAFALWIACVFVVILVLARVAHVPLASFVARIALVQPFVLGIAVLALFQSGGFAVFLAIAVKSTASVGALQLLASTTPFHEILEVLRRARVPALLLLVLSLLHRYLFVVIEESRRMRRARGLRTAKRGSREKWRAHSAVIALSFVRSVARTERIAMAMKARGGP